MRTPVHVSLCEAETILQRINRHNWINRRDGVRNKEDKWSRFVAKAVRNICRYLERRLV